MALRVRIAAIFLLTSVPALSQNFEGAFARGQKENEETYFFWKDGHFWWSKTDAKESTSGNGSYTVKNDSIYLTFTKANLEVDLNATTYHGPSSTESIKISAIHSTGQPVQGLKFYLSKSKGSSETDKSGNGAIGVEHPPIRDYLYLEFNSRTLQIPVYLKQFTYFFPIVVDDTYKYKENVQISFKFKRTARKLILTGTNGPATFKKSKEVYLDPNHEL
jgi:hypothetical protein